MENCETSTKAHYEDIYVEGRKPLDVDDDVMSKILKLSTERFFAWFGTDGILKPKHILIAITGFVLCAIAQGLHAHINMDWQNQYVHTIISIGMIITFGVNVFVSASDIDTSKVNLIPLLTSIIACIYCGHDIYLINSGVYHALDATPFMIWLAVGVSFACGVGVLMLAYLPGVIQQSVIKSVSLGSTRVSIEDMTEIKPTLLTDLDVVASVPNIIIARLNAAIKRNPHMYSRITVWYITKNNDIAGDLAVTIDVKNYCGYHLVGFINRETRFFTSPDAKVKLSKKDKAQIAKKLRNAMLNSSTDDV